MLQRNVRCGLRCSKLTNPKFLGQNILYIHVTWRVSIERPRFPSGYDWVGWDTAPQAGRSRVRLPMRQMGLCITNFFQLQHSLGVETASNKNVWQQYVLVCEGGRCLKLSSLLPSYAGSLEILRASNSWSSHGLCKPVWVCFISIVNAKLHNSESRMTGARGYAVRLATSLEFLPYFYIDRRRVMCCTVLVLAQIVTFK